jgi:hypothetical protein
MFKEDKSKVGSLGVKYVPPGRARSKGVLLSKINEAVEALIQKCLEEIAARGQEEVT